jgi:hypothetical protein
MEAHANRHTSIDCQYAVDDLVHLVLEALLKISLAKVCQEESQPEGIQPSQGLREVNVDELKWELLTEVQGRLEAEFIKSYFGASGIEIELFQESVGHHIYPVTVDGLGRVQLFVSKEQAKEAHQLLDEYNNSKE